MAHPTPIKLKRGRPSPKEVARKLGMSATEYERLGRLVQDVLGRDAAKVVTKKRRAGG